MTYLLFLDTTTSLGKIALFDENRLIDHAQIHSLEQTKTLLPLLDDLLKKHNLPLTSINGVAACIGPGSFTGTRIGLITAKTLAFVKKCPLILIDAFDPYLDKGKSVILQNRTVLMIKDEDLSPRIISEKELALYTKPLTSPHPIPNISTEKCEYCLLRIGKILMKKWERGEFCDPKTATALYLEELI